MSGPRRARLSESDRALWAAYAQQVRPIAGRDIPVVPPESPAPAPAPRAPPAPPPTPRRAPPEMLSVGDRPGGVDNATWQRFRGGKLAAARTLDLHGRTAQRAHVALEHFLRTAHAEGLRCVEVITGRGSGEAGGVIRRELPLWLNLPHLRPLILGVVHPHPANPGSVRILLRRIR